MNVNLTEFMALPILELGNNIMNIRQKKRAKPEKGGLDESNETSNSPPIIKENNSVNECLKQPAIESNTVILQENLKPSAIIKGDVGFESPQKLIFSQPSGKLCERFSQSPGIVRTWILEQQSTPRDRFTFTAYKYSPPITPHYHTDAIYGDFSNYEQEYPTGNGQLFVASLDENTPSFEQELSNERPNINPFMNNFLWY